MAFLTDFGMWRRRFGRSAIAVMMAIAVGGGVHGARAAPLETAIEATYLFKFAPYIEWPNGVAPAAANFLICVVGDDPFDGTLDRAIAGEHIGSRAIVLRRLGDATPQTICDIMYVSGSPRQTVASALAAVAGLPVLTVTDQTRNGGPAGIINFVVQDNRVRFQIDEAAAMRNGLRISSKLLSLALSVRRRS
jgi:hypothetical protein